MTIYIIVQGLYPPYKDILEFYWIDYEQARKHALKINYKQSVEWRVVALQNINSQQ